MLPAARSNTDGAQLVKTGSPDGGLEWYVTLRNGVQWGWQAKFTFNIDDAPEAYGEIAQDRGREATEMPTADLLHPL